MARTEDLSAKRMGTPRAGVSGWLRHKVHAAWRERWAYVFVAPAVIVFAIFRIYPALLTLQYSFARVKPQAINWVGLDNFASLLRDSMFWGALRVTFIYSVITVPVGLAIALLLSVLIFGLRDSLQAVFKAGFYLPRVASAVVIALVWRWIYEPIFGLANYLLSVAGIAPQLWLSDPSLALVAMIIMEMMASQGGSIVLLTAAMGSIPKELYEAAQLDGAGALNEFFRVTLPLLRSTLLYVAVTSTINAFKFFTPIYVLTKGGPYFATNTLVYYVFELAFNRYDFGKASAVSMVLFVILLVLSLAYYRLLNRELEY